MLEEQLERYMNIFLQHQPQIQQQGVYGVNSLQSATRLTSAYPSYISSGGYGSSRGRFIESPELNSIGHQQQLAALNSRQNNLYSQESAGPSFQSNDLQWLYGSEGQTNAETRW
jgi:hypothetical protein